MGNRRSSIKRTAPRTVRCTAALLALGLTTLGASPAAAANEACREWWGEHHRWKAEVVRRYLRGSAQRELDEAVFELLQREAWLTSCEQHPDRARDGLVGWRLIHHVPDEYAGAVVDSLLERAGFDLSLETLVGPAAMPLQRPDRHSDRTRDQTTVRTSRRNARGPR